MNNDMSEVISNLSKMLNNPNMKNNLNNFFNSMNNGQNAATNGPQNNFSNQDYYDANNNTNSNTTNNFSDNNNDSTNNPFGNIDMDTLMKIQKIMTSVNDKQSDSRTNLLMSLKPFLRENRKNKIDQYVQLMKMEKIFEIINPLGGDDKHV